MAHKVPDPSTMICGYILKPFAAKVIEKSVGRESRSRGHSTSLMKKRYSITSDKANRSQLSAAHRAESSGKGNTILNTSKNSNHKPKGKLSRIFGSEAKAKLQSFIERQIDSDAKSATKRNSSVKSRQPSRDTKLSAGSRQQSQNRKRVQLLGSLNSGSDLTKRAAIFSSPKVSLLKGSTPRTDQPAGPLFFRKEQGSKKQKASEHDSERGYTNQQQSFHAQGLARLDKRPDKEELNHGSKKATDKFDINKDYLLRMFATQGGMKDIGSHSFLSKFSLLSSKTSIGESRQSIDKKKDAKMGYALTIPSNSQKVTKADLFKASFLQKKD